MALVAGLAGGASGAHAAQAKGKAKPAPKAGIVLYCDLVVDPRREQEMLRHFHQVFKPAGAKFKGFIDLKMLKLRTHIQGPPAIAGVNYRFQLTYENEELRQIWVKSKTHEEVWGGIENCLADKNFQVLLFDVA
jgi:hypothetical protein